MNKKTIFKKEKTNKLDAKYYYVQMEKPQVQHSGETVEDFIARGGAIKQIVPKKKKNIEKDDFSEKAT